MFSHLPATTATTIIANASENFKNNSNNNNKNNQALSCMIFHSSGKLMKLMDKRDCDCGSASKDVAYTPRIRRVYAMWRSVA